MSVTSNKMSDDINTISTNNVSETVSLNCGPNTAQAGLSTPVTTPEPKSMSNQSGSRSEIHYPGVQNPSRIYESKKNRKLFRILTVFGYMFAVSLAAIVLSLYYIFLWNPNMQINNSSQTIRFNANNDFVLKLKESDVYTDDSVDQSNDIQRQKTEQMFSSSQLLLRTTNKTSLNTMNTTTTAPMMTLPSTTTTSKINVTTNVVRNSHYLSDTLSVSNANENVYKLVPKTRSMYVSASDGRVGHNIIVSHNNNNNNNENKRPDIKTLEILNETNETEININDNHINNLLINRSSTQGNH
ncbi:putative uncharacterized protein DDB_G0289263 [Oppia nitens]|uniref:putative uncharacterized protein DDB_G0289263 n=1 Tax=Oppia nitens TaxID=1686743 RepID=UPI0023DBB476|nr:putative uncharacterized protein DDB_G0289263 [Oppia nitens]